VVHARLSDPRWQLSKFATRRRHAGGPVLKSLARPAFGNASLLATRDQFRGSHL
jgi:hypothetical protein